MIAEIKKALAQGQFAESIKLAQNGIKTEQDVASQKELHYLLAVAFRLSGTPDKAISSNQQLIQQYPEHARCWQELGHCYVALNQPHDAAKHFYKATQLNPALLASWRYLESYYQQSQNSQALALARKQTQRLSALPKPILGARDLMYEGHLDTADKLCRQFLSQNKHHAEALTLLGEIGLQLKAYAEAEFVLESCVALYPDHYYAGLEYIKLLNQIGKFRQSLQTCDTLLQHYPQEKSFLLAKAGALLGIGDIQGSVTLYQALLAQDEQQPYINLLLGHALKADGQLQAAIAAYRTAWQIKPDFGDAYWSLANTKTYQFQDVELQAMTSLTRTDDTSTDDRIHLHFALGKAYEDKKQYPLAFEHFQKGNQLKQAQLNYDIASVERQVERQIAHCNSALFTNLPDVGCDDAAPIFIVGLPRAGSTLLEQILASHSQVEGTMELHNILSLVTRLRGNKNAYPDNLTQIDSGYYARFGEQYIQDTQVYRSNKPYFIDKMPNNFLHLGLIKLILPNAKVIDARRAPMDCCFSGYKQLFGEGQEFSYSLDTLARYYLAYEKLMAHWDEVLPGFVLRVQHEDVLDDLESQVRRILAFCNLPFEESCLRFYETERAIKTPSSEQVKQPINRKGQGIWRHYDSQLTALKAHFPQDNTLQEP
ncbi:tetratricopeptide repeat-containing sulfotransferase family protein [Planctobacterium marinum]|uniref:tetratricopeptide repeat-containing sulfotransferase family protein n=1 Tax=Planctobacterium marinum TaxID=1631968 RepID=UPI001E2AC403|nr:tetratricopeptide repeat-containing sulfotransferase family protein [Planctobacterium marinum]MCC2603769.1 sulfotransferase [Planctobacterium marinum]